MAKKFHTSELSRSAAEAAATNLRAMTAQLAVLRGLYPPPPPRTIPAFRRRLAVTFIPPVQEPLKIRHRAGQPIQNLGTPPSETQPAENRRA